MLDELVNTIETLKARISKHRTALQASEAQTRLSLIDPLLRALGWDTADPALVRPEFVLSTGRADYALLDANQRPVAIVEAKKLNEPLGNAEMQLLPYAFASNVGYAVLTDGDHWVMFRVFRQKQDDESRVLDVSIANSPAYECALKLLLLWHRNLESGQPIEAREPIMGIETPDTATLARIQTGVQTSPTAQWISLREFSATKGSTAPQRVRFPDGDEKTVLNWSHLAFEISEWLVRQGTLTPGKCPIPGGPESVWYVVNLEPVHSNGHRFFKPRKLSNELFLSPHGPATSIVKRCRAMMEHLGRDPATVHVQVG